MPWTALLSLPHRDLERHRMALDGRSFRNRDVGDLAESIIARAWDRADCQHVRRPRGQEQRAPCWRWRRTVPGLVSRYLAWRHSYVASVGGEPRCGQMSEKFF
jgi:hypothetical protein